MGWDISIVQEIIDNYIMCQVNIDYLIAEKWSSQNQTSLTGFATPVIFQYGITIVVILQYLGLA